MIQTTSLNNKPHNKNKNNNNNNNNNNKTPIIILFTTITILTCIKLLLLPSYRSTDFDVHRNWLAITRHLPPSQWYYDDQNGTTVHTLDYPPLFALFEFLLSSNPLTNWLLDNGWVVGERCFERLPDDDNEVGDDCVRFQRLTVILSDVFLVGGAWFSSRAVWMMDDDDDIASQRRWGWIGLTCAILIITNPGLLLLDHVHFQYNGMLLGILLLSIGCIHRYTREWVKSDGGGGYHLMGAILFAILLTMKHLYLPLAPIYFVYLLRLCCIRPARGGGGGNQKSHNNENAESSSVAFSMGRFIPLAVITLLTLLLPFLPFLVNNSPLDQLSQMLKRLFPFSRGLCHDYWAANVWALYLFFEKCVGFVHRRLSGGGSLSLVIPSSFPEVPPKVTAVLLLVALVPSMMVCWMGARRVQMGRLSPMANVFIHAVVYSSFSSFMLAYHAHEKAIMTAIIPLTLLAPSSLSHARLYVRTCALGHFGLFPLLFRPTELLFKTTSYLAHLSFSVGVLEWVVCRKKTTGRDGDKNEITKDDGGEKEEGIVTTVDKIGFIILTLLFLFAEVIHPFYFKPRGRLEFLPLMAISVTCAVGLFICWIHSGLLMWQSLRQQSSSSSDHFKSD